MILGSSVGMDKDNAHNLNSSLPRLPQKCPFCPSQTKRTFDQVGLLQHAIAITKHNGNPEMVRAHSTLLRGLNIEPKQENSKALQQKPVLAIQENSDLQKEAAHALGQPNETNLVWPWMGIVANIDYEHLGNGKNKCNPAVDPWNVDIKAHFSYLNPKGVHALWKQGIAVLDFGHDLIGFFDAHDFERGFLRAGRGRLEWINMIKLGRERVKEWFGWIADKRDFNNNNLVGDYLRRRGTLRAVPRFQQAWTEQHNQLFHDMRSKLQEKNLKLVELGRENFDLQTVVYQTENEKYSAEAKWLQSEAKHNQEMETMKEKLSDLIQVHSDQLSIEKQKLDCLQKELSEMQKNFQESLGKQIASEETVLCKLTDLLEEKEGLEDTVQTLIYKEREANDKIQNAMKACVEILQIKGDNQFFGNKRVGMLNDAPWKIACAQKFKYHNDGWETMYASLISGWEKNLKDSSWYPYKIATSGSGKAEEHIDDGDEKLKKLKDQLGADVYKSVVDALNELKEYNASGRYPISVPWNFKLNRPAHLEEILRYLAAEKPMKKRRIPISGS